MMRTTPAILTAAAICQIGACALAQSTEVARFRTAGDEVNNVDLVGAGTVLVEGSGQNARATGGPGILPGVSNIKVSAKATVLGDEVRRIDVLGDDRVMLRSPAEGLWSVATGWKDGSGQRTIME